MNQSKTLPNILLIGDFNFPGITWNSGYGQISTPTYGSRLNSLFLEIINDVGLEQFVHQATRQNNILDLQWNLYERTLRIADTSVLRTVNYGPSRLLIVFNVLITSAQRTPPCNGQRTVDKYLLVPYAYALTSK